MQWFLVWFLLFSSPVSTGQTQHYKLEAKQIKWLLYGYYIGRQFCVPEVCLNMLSKVNHTHGLSWPSLLILGDVFLKDTTKFNGWLVFFVCLFVFLINETVYQSLSITFKMRKIKFSSRRILFIIFYLTFSMLIQRHTRMTEKRGRNPCQA